MRMSRSFLLSVLAGMLSILPAAARAAEPSVPAEAPGFHCYGYAAVAPQARGIYATQDGQGRPIIMIWPMDADGTRDLLVVDADSGETEQVALPGGAKLTPYTAILSRDNKFYTQFGGRFYAFDPAERQFTFHGDVGDDLAMWMTEDDQGRIWAGIYPNAHLVSFDPKSRELIDYGAINKENWPQYPRRLTSDAAGWIYMGIGDTNGIVLAFDPQARATKPLLQPEERGHGLPEIFRGTNGRVYFRLGGGQWFEAYAGERAAVDKPPVEAVREKVNTQAAVFGDLPDGRKVTRVSLPDKVIVVEGPEGSKRLQIDYDLPGTHILSLVAAPDGESVIGSTGLPLRLFRVTPGMEDEIPHQGPGVDAHVNAWASRDDVLFGATYVKGRLIAYRPSEPIGPDNPRVLMAGPPHIIRPHALLAHSDGRHLIMGGTPAYGRTGGGLVIYDDAAGTGTVLTHEQLLPNLSTKALENLEDGTVLGGTSTAPGTGGERLASIAELYIFDLAEKKIVWHAPALEGVEEYRDFKLANDGLVYGLADRGETPVFFIFDPAARKVVHQAEVTGFGRTAGAQAPRILAEADDGTIYALFSHAIGKIVPGSRQIEKVAELPAQAHAGFVLIDHHLYYADSNRVWSYDLNTN